MKIISADIYDVDLCEASSIWNLAIIRLRTDDGLSGIGEVGLAYGTGKSAAVGMLRDMVEAFVIGADPRQVEYMWHRLFRDTFWGQGGGPVLYGAMSAVDEALWDIKGKALDVPVYEMLGGKTRDRIRVYANGWYRQRPSRRAAYCNLPEEYAEAALRTVEDGFDALKFDPFYVGPDGVKRPPERQVTREIAELAYKRVSAVREAVGPEVDILIEAHGNFGVSSAIEIGRQMAKFAPFFYEEPVDALNVECMLKVSQAVPIPIAAGERLYTRYGFREYIEKQAIDILQPDTGLAGGITELKKIASLGEIYSLHVQPHNCGGPISTAASVQLDACITNFVIQEWFPYRGPDFHLLVEESLEAQGIINSEFTIPSSPGLGVNLNEDAIAKYPCIHVE